MSEPAADRPSKTGRLTPRRLVLAALIIAALAIAITFWVGNAGGLKASDCLQQPAAAASVDAAATGELAALNGTGTGRSYAATEFVDAGGKTVRFADFAGKFLLVNFWASWCIPCRAEMPALDKLAATENGPDFMVLPINTGEADPKKGPPFLAAGGWPNLPYFGDPTWAIYKALQVSGVTAGLPVTLLLDKKGCEIAVLQGPAAWDTPDGKRVIDALRAI